MSVYEFFLFLVKTLPLLVVLDEPRQNFSHELVMILHKLLLFSLLISFRIYGAYLLPTNVLEYSLHVLVVFRERKFGQRDSA